MSSGYTVVVAFRSLLFPRMLSMRNLLIGIIVPVLLIKIVHSNSYPPRCLDFQSPFESNASPGFCADYNYTTFGCCGTSDDKRLLDEYDYIKSKVKRDEWDTCEPYIKEILCQKCSPYATHLYDALTSKGKSFPSLCEDFCGLFWDKCRIFLWFLDPGLAVKSILYTKQWFCKSVKVDKYCYPKILETGAEDSSDPKCICLKEVGTRLANPLYARSPNDGTGRVFVAEQRGRVLIYNSRTEKWNKIPFMDIRLRVTSTYFAADERGFYTIAFHPNFKQNKKFFISYFTQRPFWETSVPDEYKNIPLEFPFKLKFCEMTVSELSPDIANPFSEKTILEVLQPYKSHNGGEMFFGQDGYLYTIHGDGGYAGDPYNMSQNKALPFGKVFRLDVDSDPKKLYTIPPDNPFVDEDGTKPEIYAYGIRNMWRCGIDPGNRTTGEFQGRVLCGDVGQYIYEEINELKKGANYGWRAREGFECFDEEMCGNIGEEQLPITSYNHTIGISVTGGVFYRGCQNPNLDGYYIYGDFGTRRLFTLLNDTGTWLNENLPTCSKYSCQGNLLSKVGGSILSFGQDEDGESYILTSKSASSLRINGNMYKIVDPTSRVDPSECQNAVSDRQRVPFPKRNPLWIQAYKLQAFLGSSPFAAFSISKLINSSKIKQY